MLTGNFLDLFWFPWSSHTEKIEWIHNKGDREIILKLYIYEINALTTNSTVDSKRIYPFTTLEFLHLEIESIF
jgi:hypothetical protein